MVSEHVWLSPFRRNGVKLLQARDVRLRGIVTFWNLMEGEL